jgi:non-ribosomal peptide synthetase component E (peptide arylation enzyme)
MENISAGELENLLFTHPSVKDVAVIGVPDPYVGERACAVIVPTSLSAPPTLAELSAHLLSSGLSKRKLPERLEIVDELPRNAMRKVLKAELRRRFIPEPHDASL